MVVLDPVCQTDAYLSPSVVIMARTTTSTGEWERFQKNPLPGVHVANLTRCLAPLRIEDESRLRQAFEVEPFRSSLIDLLRQTLGVKPLAQLTVAPEEAGFVALDVAGWERAAGACGLMFWSQALARELRAPVLRSLETYFGASWWRWVELGQDLAHDTALAAQARHRPDTAQEWISGICDVGFAVLDAKVSLLDEDLAAWVHLKRPLNSDVAGVDGIRHVDEKLAVALVDVLNRHLRESS